MFKALDDYKKVLEGKDYDAVAKGWQAVGAACKACHEEYKQVLLQIYKKGSGLPEPILFLKLNSLSEFFV